MMTKVKKIPPKADPPLAEKNKLNNKSPDIHEEIRHLGVMIESINNKLEKLIAERYGNIKEKS